MSAQPPSDTERLLHSALARAFAGWTLLDHELQLSSGDAVEWVGRDAAGQLLLVTLGETQARASALRALELAVAARKRECDLMDQYGGSEVRVVLLLEAAQVEVAELLAPLEGRPLLFYECVEMHSAQGTQLKLRPIAVDAAPLLATREAFMAALAPQPRACAERIAQTLESPALGARARIEARTLHWSAAGAPLCSLHAVEAGLEGRVRGEESAQVLRSPTDAAQFLDEVLREYLRNPAAQPEDLGAITAKSAFDPRAPVLTHEELAAFRDAD